MSWLRPRKRENAWYGRNCTKWCTGYPTSVKPAGSQDRNKNRFVSPRDKLIWWSDIVLMIIMIIMVEGRSDKHTDINTAVSPWSFKTSVKTSVILSHPLTLVKLYDSTNFNLSFIMNLFKGTFTQTGCLRQHFCLFMDLTMLHSCAYKHRKQLSVCDCGDVWCPPLSCTHLFTFYFIFGTLGRRFMWMLWSCFSSSKAEILVQKVWNFVFVLIMSLLSLYHWHLIWYHSRACWFPFLMISPICEGCAFVEWTPQLRSEWGVEENDPNYPGKQFNDLLVLALVSRVVGELADLHLTGNTCWLYKVWIQCGEPHADCCIDWLPCCLGGDSIMVWGSISIAGKTGLVTTEDHLSAARHHGEILQPVAVP